MTDYNMRPLPIIQRPIILIEELPNGNFTFTLRSPGSNYEHVRTESHADKKVTLGKIKSCHKEHKRLANEIETGKRDPYHIVGMWTQRGLFRTRTVYIEPKYEF